MSIWLIGFLTAFALFQLVSIPGLILKKNDLADVLWGPAFIISALAAAHWGVEDGLSGLRSRSGIVLLVLSIWSIRLFIHVGLRNLSTVKEDVRYYNWRVQWGKTQVWRSYLQVFVLQPIILYIFLIPVLLAIDTNELVSWVMFCGLAIWIFGFSIEMIADEQLRRFKSESTNKGKIMTSGLWSWSRHPNYFGEVVQWWGIWLMVIDLPYGWATIVSPIGVTYLLLKVSGVDMLEELMQKRPGYGEYAARTSVFIPMPPSKTKSDQTN